MAEAIPVVPTTPDTPLGHPEATNEGIRLTSTSDTQEQVDAAMGQMPGVETPEPVVPELVPPTPVVPEPPRESRVERRIATLTARNYDKDARIAQLEQDLAAATTPPLDPVAPSEPASQPVPDDFTTTEAYIEAMAGWKAQAIVTQELAARDTHTREAQAARTQASAREVWTEQITATRAEHADYDEVVSACTEPTSLAFGQVLMQMDRGADILYALAKQPGETTRINDLSPFRMVQELTRLGDTLPVPAAPVSPETEGLAPSEAAAPAVPVAPVEPPATVAAPLAPLTPAPAETVVAPEDMDFQQYKAWRLKTGRAY